MLFHTAQFLLAFLPVTLAGYYALGRLPGKAAFAWLALASLFFYGWWDVRFVALIALSIVVNYGGSRWLDRLGAAGRPRAQRVLLATLITANLAALAWFKYLMFFAAQARALFDIAWDPGLVVLPIGISFYTFTQIAFLADCVSGKARERSFTAYVLFVTYFPHLVAGPVLHHAEMMPQFADRRSLRFDAVNFAAGVTFLVFGLFKKIVLADGFAPTANEVFARAGAAGLGAADAWIGSVAYMLQIYFDFSGYSDMAIGLSLMFNVRLPVNFLSPYRAGSIIEFWRRWHMTLSRFLRDYLYIPLGGNRSGRLRRHLNLMTTMLLGGLWHGASWNFVVWGGLHGLMLVGNHLWRGATAGVPFLAAPGRTVRIAAHALTLLGVLLAWVFFRAADLPSALAMLEAMLKGPGESVHATLSTLAFLVAGAAWALFAPNTCQVMRYDFGAGGAPHAAHGGRIAWRPTRAWAAGVALLALVTLAYGLAGREKIEFLYFQF